MGCRADGMSRRWDIAPLKSRANGMSRKWDVAQLKSRATGMSRSIAKLKCRAIEMSRNWEVAQIDVALEKSRANGISPYTLAAEYGTNIFHFAFLSLVLKVSS